MFPKENINRSEILECGHHAQPVTFISTDNFMQLIHSLAASQDSFIQFQVKFDSNNNRMPCITMKT